MLHRVGVTRVFLSGVTYTRRVELKILVHVYM